VQSMTRRSVLALGALAAMPRLALSQSQVAWPERALRIVVPFPPGGTTDFVTRLVAAAVAETLGQSVVIENKPGAGTVIGVNSVAKSPADGYTFVTVANSFTVNPTLVKNLPYDTFQDLRPVALMGMAEHVLITHPGTGLRSVQDLKTTKIPLSYGSFGTGTSPHLSGEALKRQLGLDMVHVPYKGQAPALADLLGGQIPLVFGVWPECRAHIRAGRMVPLGMATTQRSVYAPDIPTLAEQGVNITSNSWNGILAPAGTSDAVVARMNQTVNQALASPNVRSAFEQGGIASLSRSTEEFGRFIRSEMEKYADIIRAANIRIDT